MDGVAATCYGDVLQLYFHGYPLTYQRPDFLNVFVFFLIFAGIILDKMGVRFTAVLSAAVMLVGACVKWYAVSESFVGTGLEAWFNNNLNYIPIFDELGVSPFYEGMPASAKFAACGFMIFGCGCEMCGITVSRGIVKWFKGREMALAMGSEMALARLGVATCMIFSPFFARLGGDNRLFLHGSEVGCSDR